MLGVVTTEPLVGALPGTIVKYARGPTNASRHSPSGLTWGGDRNRPLPSASRLSAGVWGQVREGAAGPQLRTLGPATMNPGVDQARRTMSAALTVMVLWAK